MMMEPDSQNVLVLSSPTAALLSLELHLQNHPDCSLLIIAQSGITPSDELVAALTDALQHEKILAAEAYPVDDSVFKSRPDLLTQNEVAHLSRTIVGIRCAPVRDYLVEMKSQLGHEASVQDIGIFLNRLGFSSVEVPVPSRLLGELDTVSAATQSAREWDEYISHVERYWKRNPRNFPKQFSTGLNQSEHPRVLIDASWLGAQRNGTSRVVLGFLEHIDRAIGAGDLQWNVTALVPQNTAAKLRLKFVHIKIINSFDDIDHPFALGFAVTPLTSLDRCIQLTRNCLRWAVIHLDVIALRALPHLSQQMGSLPAFEFYSEYADLTISISEFSKRDAANLNPHFHEQSWKVAHLGVPEEFQSDAALETSHNAGSQSVLVLGNDAPHKQVLPSVAQLLDAGWNVISISMQPPLSDKHTVYSPGELADEQLRSLIQSAAVVVFPSMFEGFGLPIAEVAEIGTPLVVWETAVNHEVCESLGITNVLFCSSLEDLPAITLSAKLRSTEPGKGIRRNSDFFREIVEHTKQLLQSPADMDRLHERWRLAGFMAATAEERVSRVQPEIETELLAQLHHAKLSTRVKARLSRMIGGKPSR